MLSSFSRRLQLIPVGRAAGGLSLATTQASTEVRQSAGQPRIPDMYRLSDLADAKRIDWACPHFRFFDWTFRLQVSSGCKQISSGLDGAVCKSRVLFVPGLSHFNGIWIESIFYFPALIPMARGTRGKDRRSTINEQANRPVSQASISSQLAKKHEMTQKPP